MPKVISIPGNVWDEQIASRPEVWAEFMACIEGVQFDTDEALKNEMQRLCEKHNVSGVIYHERRPTKRAADGGRAARKYQLTPLGERVAELIEQVRRR